MIYKALMLDVDGTIIPYNYEALPSKKLIDAIKKAQEKVTVCLVTGRSLYSTKRLMHSLNINYGYAVVDNGAYVINIEKKEPIYEQLIEEEDLKKIIEVFDDENVIFFYKDEKSLSRTNDDYYKPYKKGSPLEKVSMLFTDELFTLERTDRVLKRLSLPRVTIFRTRHQDPNKFAFNITHVKATKLHGVEIVAKKLGISKKEIISCGDGYNDFPLLMASGLKVAMGNAVDELKEIADFIAPTVDDDGVATVIEKYILNQ